MKDSKHCFGCRIDLSPHMMRYHLENDHMIVPCQFCTGPLLRMGLSRSPLDRAQFCSSACMNEAEERGLCIGCSIPPDTTFRHGACARCRRYGHYRIPAITEVTDQLRAIRRARLLPLPYQRRERRPA